VRFPRNQPDALLPARERSATAIRKDTLAQRMVKVSNQDAIIQSQTALLTRSLASRE